MADLASLTIQVDSRKARSAQSDLKGLERQSKSTEDSTGKLTRTANRQQEEFRRLARGARVAAGAIAAIGAAAVGVTRQSLQFNRAFAEVITLLDRGNPAIGKLREETQKLSAQFGTSNVEQAQALYQVISAGASNSAQAIDQLTAANKLALGGVTETRVAVDGLTTVMNAFGSAAGSATDVSDAFFVAVRAGKTTVDELSTAIGRVAPLAATAEVSLEEMLSVVATLTTQGLSTAEAVTGLRGVLQAVIRPTEQSKEAAEKLGISFDLASLRAKGFTQFLKDVDEAAEGNDQALGRLFGEIEGLNAILALTGGTGGAKFTQIMENMADKAGQTAEAVAKIEENDPQTQLDKLSAAFGNLTTAMGDAITQSESYRGSVDNAITRTNQWTEVVKAAASETQNLDFSFGRGPDGKLGISIAIETADEAVPKLGALGGVISDVANGIRQKLVPAFREARNEASQAGNDFDFVGSVFGGVKSELEALAKEWENATRQGKAQVDQLEEQIATFDKGQAAVLRYKAEQIELNDTYGDASDQVADLMRELADLNDAKDKSAEAAKKQEEAERALNQRLSEQQALLDRLNPQQAASRQFGQDIQNIFDMTLGGGMGGQFGGSGAFGMDFLADLANNAENLGDAFELLEKLVNDTAKGQGGGGDGGIFDSSIGQDQAVQQASVAATNAIGQSLGVPTGGIGSALGGIAGAFLGGPIGSAVGSLIGGAADSLFAGSADNGPPEFGISTGAGSAPGDPRTTSPVFGTDIVGHHFDDITNAAFQQILDSLAQFDRDIAQIFDPSDFDAITAAMANFDETFEEGVATMEEAMERRFITALEAAEPAVAGFVQSFGDLESMKEALQGIFDMRDAIDDFGNTMLALGDPVDQITARLNRMQSGLEDAQTSFDQALLAQDPAAIAQTGQALQQALVEKFELEKRLIEDLQSQLRDLEVSGRDFRANIADRLADLGGRGDLRNLAQTAGANLRGARQDVLNADDTQAALRNLDAFVSRVDDWLDAARRRVTEIRDMELERINQEMQALAQEEEQILAQARERSQNQQAVSQAAASARQAELDALNSQIEAAREWQGVVDSIEQQLKNLRFGQVNPASGFTRLESLNREISGFGAADTPGRAKELQDLLQRRLQLAQQQFQRPSGEFQSIFNETVRQLEELQGKAKSEAEIANDLQEKANQLQAQTTTSVQRGVQLTAEEQRRLEEIRDQQAELEAEAQAVRERADARLEEIEANARGFYEWAQGQRESLEAQRHAELTDQLNAITGGLDANSYIAQRQAEVVDRLTTIRDTMQNFLDSISGQSVGGNGGGGGSGPPGGGGGPPNPTLPESGTVINIGTIRYQGPGGSAGAKRFATHLKRELKTA